MTTPAADRRGLRLIVAALVAAVLLSSLDAMIFNTALPTIVGQLHGIARMSWVPTAYLLTTVITPIAVLAIVAAIALLHPPRPAARPHLDAPGIVLVALAVTGLLVLTSTGGRTVAWTSPAALALGAVAVLAAAGFVVAERRAREPLIPLRLLADRDFVLATVGGLCGALAMFGAAGYLPTYLQMVDGLTPSVAGLHMMPMVAGIGTTAFTSGHMMSRTGRYAWMPVAGALVVAGALGLLSLLRVSTSPWVVCADVYLFGAGLGFGMQTLVIVAQNAVPAGVVGTATAGFAFFREIGAAPGSAAVGGLFTARLTALLGQRLPARLADAHALTPALGGER